MRRRTWRPFVLAGLKAPVMPSVPRTWERMLPYYLECDKFDARIYRMRRGKAWHLAFRKAKKCPRCALVGEWSSIFCNECSWGWGRIAQSGHMSHAERDCNDWVMAVLANDLRRIASGKLPAYAVNWRDGALPLTDAERSQYADTVTAEMDKKEMEYGTRSEREIRSREASQRWRAIRKQKALANEP